MEYDVYLHRVTFDFLRQLRRDDRKLLLGLLGRLGQDPFQQGDFTMLDLSGRRLEGVIVRRYAVLFWVDHATKEIKVTDIRFADR